VTQRVTGERVSTAQGGFNPTFQRHVATYRLCAPLLPAGRVLDLGCGVGHSWHELLPRETVGVDRDARVLEGQGRETVAAATRARPFEADSFDGVLSVQSIEHVPDPERVIAEVRRVLRPGGVAVFATPNRLTFARPDEIIDPFHYVELDPRQLRDLAGRAFDDVEVRGLFGSARQMAFVAREKRRLDALLARDPLRTRRLVPRRVRMMLYDALLNRHRRDPDPEAAAITPDDFELRAGDPDAALDLVAICR
jgi:SAM-dependent methyltransferase